MLPPASRTRCCRSRAGAVWLPEGPVHPVSVGRPVVDGAASAAYGSVTAGEYDVQSGHVRPLVTE